jgi:hypothetical protein
MCGTMLMVTLGKTKAEKKQGNEKVAKADDGKTDADVGKVDNLKAGDTDRVSHSLFFVPTSAHGFESLDLTNHFRILFHLRRCFIPSPPQCLLTEVQLDSKPVASE